MSGSYQQMWEDFGKNRGEVYLQYKFQPTHRAGMTNFLREEEIYRYLEPKPTDVVLDVGCASGLQIFRLAPKIKEGIGVDIARSFIDTANQEKIKRGISNVSFAQAVVETLPFEDAKFDKIICGEVLEHVHDKDAALSEIARVLKPGGMFVVSVPNLNADATWWGRLLRRLGIRSFTSLEQFSEAELIKHGDAHVREFDKRTLPAWLESRGFRVAKISSVSFIDGPGFDFLLKFPLHFGWSRWIVLRLERFLTRSHGFWGRHLVVQAYKS